MANWAETKHEYKKLAGDEMTVITKEPSNLLNQNQKDIIDIAVKFIGALAIFIPLFLFYLQYDKDAEKKKNESLSELLVNISFDIERLKNRDIKSEPCITSLENLLYKYPSKVAVFKYDRLNSLYHSLLEAAKNLRTSKELQLYSPKIVTTYMEALGRRNYQKIDRDDNKYKVTDADLSNKQKGYQLDTITDELYAYIDTFESYKNDITKINTELTTRKVKENINLDSITSHIIALINDLHYYRLHLLGAIKFVPKSYMVFQADFNTVAKLNKINQLIKLNISSRAVALSQKQTDFQNFALQLISD